MGIDSASETLTTRSFTTGIHTLGKTRRIRGSIHISPSNSTAPQNIGRDMYCVSYPHDLAAHRDPALQKAIDMVGGS